MSSYLTDIKSIYLASFRFALACPLLFLIPGLAEFVQHIVEIQIGMYASTQAFTELAFDDNRQLAGMLKICGLTLPGYWFVRYLGFGYDGQAARRVEFPAFGLWLVVFLFSVPVAALSLYSGELASHLDIEPEKFGNFMAGFNLFFMVFGIYILGWTVAWPLGNPAMTWIASMRLMYGHFIRAVIYMIAANIVYMPLHYGLAHLALGGGPTLVWAMLTLDSLLVAVMALNIVGAGYFAVAHAANDKAVNLLPIENVN